MFPSEKNTTQNLRIILNFLENNSILKNKNLKTCTIHWKIVNNELVPEILIEYK